MPSPADSDLFRRDVELPGLSTLLDPDALAKIIAGRDARSVDRLDLLYLRYKPGTNCVAAYRAHGAGGETLLYAKAHGGDAAAKLAKARLRTDASDASVPERVFVPSLGIVVFGFPDDVKLPVLSRLADPSERLRLLTRVLGEAAVSPAHRLETLAYKPERRYVARFTPEGAEGGAVLKFYGRERHRSARRAKRALESRGRLQLPQKCGGSKRHGVLALSWLAGSTLREELDAGGAPDLVSVGGAIAELHAQCDADLPERGAGARLSDLHDLARTLGFICPAQGDDARRLAERITSRLAGEQTSTTAIHGDLYDKQIVMNGDRIGLVDLDDATRGEARQDLGLFIAHLERDRLMGRAIDAIDEIRGSLLEGYQQVTGQRVDGLGPFVAEGLLRLAHHPFRRHGPAWPEQTRGILERASELLAECAARR